MVLPGHLAAGYLVSFGVLKFAASWLSISLTRAQTVWLFIVGTLLGDGPDVDAVFGIWKSKSLSPKGLDGHRKYPTHAPVLWFVLGLAIFLAARIFGNSGAPAFFQVLGLLVWLGPWSHFLCDSLENGVMWLWPLTTRQFALHNPAGHNDDHPRDWRSLFSGYIKSPVSWVEMLLVFTALVTFLKSY